MFHHRGVALCASGTQTTVTLLAPGNMPVNQMLAILSFQMAVIEAVWIILRVNHCTSNPKCQISAEHNWGNKTFYLLQSFVYCYFFVIEAGDVRQSKAICLFYLFKYIIRNKDSFSVDVNHVHSIYFS